MIIKAAISAAFLLLSVTPARDAAAEWTAQTLTLQPGWNAVFLQIQPADDACEAIFADTPVRSVWAWNREFQTVQYVADPETLVPDNPDWLTWFAPSEEKSFLSDLFALNAGKCYLIESAAEAPFDLVVEGRPVVQKQRWLQNSFNLVGFHLGAESQPTFASFFSGDPALSGQAIFRTLPSGQSEQVANPENTQLRPGEAYWVYCKGATDFSGPLKVEVPQSDGLNFADVLREQTVALVNDSAVDREVTIRLLPSHRPQDKTAAKNLKALAGPVALSYFRMVSWAELNEPISVTLAPGVKQGLQLAVRRAAMNQSNDPDAVYESVLEISDNHGMRYVLPVTAKGAIDYTGLWVGNVALNGVNEVSNSATPDTPTPTSSTFNFRIIVHIDENGSAHLLQHVSLMQVEAQFAPDPNDPSVQIETAPARYVLVTDDALLPSFQGIAIRDGKIVGRRISAPAFGFPTPVAMTGTLSTPVAGVDLIANVNMDFNDPLNPFVHRYHPDHNNMDERFENMLPAGTEAWSFSRQITLDFTSEDPEQLGLPEWGYEVIGGNYREVLSGVHRRDIHVSGTFKLHRITDVAELNDGQ